MRNGTLTPPIAKPEGWIGIYFHDRAGETHPGARLTASAARWVVRCSRNGIETDELAAMLGVSPHTIRGILSGRRYASDTEKERRQ